MSSVNKKTFKYFVFGVDSAVYSWLSLALVVLVAYFESLQSVIGIVIFLPPVILALILYYALNKYRHLKSGRAGLNKFILIVFCETGWVVAMLVSTIGEDFPPIIDTSFYTTFISALPASLVGMLFVAFAIYRCIKIPSGFSLIRFFSVMLMSSIIGIAVFSFIYSYLTGNPVYLMAFSFDKLLSDTLIYLLLFMSWHVTLFMTLPLVISDKMTEIK